MPFRGGNEIRRRVNGKGRTDDRGEVPTYSLGYVFLGPLPGQPWWTFNLDMVFHGNLLYVLGSVLYVAQALYYIHSLHLSEWDDDYNPQNPSNYLNLAGSALFIANALVCTLDWWLCKRSACIFNMSVDGTEDRMKGPGIEEDNLVRIRLIEMSTRLLDLYFWNNVFFMLAAIVFQIAGAWQFNSSLNSGGCLGTICSNFVLPLVGNLFYLFASLCSVAEYFEQARNRKTDGLPPLSMYSAPTLSQIDWFGIGDWLFFLAAVMPVVQSFYQYFNPWENGDVENACVSPYYLVNQIIWLLDSLAYMIGYAYFLQDLILSTQRCAKQQSPAKQENQSDQKSVVANPVFKDEIPIFNPAFENSRGGMEMSLITTHSINETQRDSTITSTKVSE